MLYMFTTFEGTVLRLRLKNYLNLNQHNNSIILGLYGEKGGTLAFCYNFRCRMFHFVSYAISIASMYPLQPPNLCSIASITCLTEKISSKIICYNMTMCRYDICYNKNIGKSVSGYMSVISVHSVYKPVDDLAHTLLSFKRPMRPQRTATVPIIHNFDLRQMLLLPPEFWAE